jgi:hypothetical protein
VSIVAEGFAPVFSRDSSKSRLSLLKTISPRAICVDLDGDGVLDSVALGTIRENASLEEVQRHRFQKPSAITNPLKAELGPERVLAYRNALVLFVVFGNRSRENRTLGLVDFCARSTTRMEVVSGQIRAEAYPDTARPPVIPQLRGKALRFAADPGSSFIVFYSRNRFQWVLAAE